MGVIVHVRLYTVHWKCHNCIIMYSIYLQKRICLTYHAVPPTIVIRQGTLLCRGNVSTVCAIMTGTTGYLECSTVGVPTPNVTLTSDAAVSCNVMVNGNQVIVTSAVAGNAGNYTCNASNFLGFDKQTSELLVGSKYCKFKVIRKRKSVIRMLLAVMHSSFLFCIIIYW